MARYGRSLGTTKVLDLHGPKLFTYADAFTGALTLTFSTTEQYLSTKPPTPLILYKPAVSRAANW